MSRYPIGKVILLADDDPDDWILFKSAMRETGMPMDLRMVVDGEELMEYLTHRGRYEDETLAPEPSLILLDLNMPRKDGREALAEIKSDRSLKRIPVVVFTTSSEDQDIIRSYELGASSYVTKPCSFEGMLDMARTMSRYWLEVVELPSGSRPRSYSMEGGDKNYRQDSFGSV